MSLLDVKFTNDRGKAVVASSYFTPPLKIFSPFYDDGFASLMLLNVSAGIMAGDRHDIRLTLGEGCNVALETQSFEKIHKMPLGKSASRDVHIVLDEDSTLIYSPLPCIPFEDSEFYSKCRVDMARGSRMCFSEIVAGGRIFYRDRHSEGEKFYFRIFSQMLEVYREGELVLLDKLFLRGGKQDFVKSCRSDNLRHCGAKSKNQDYRDSSGIRPQNDIRSNNDTTSVMLSGSETSLQNLDSKNIQKDSSLNAQNDEKFNNNEAISTPSSSCESLPTITTTSLCGRWIGGGASNIDSQKHNNHVMLSGSETSIDSKKMTESKQTQNLDSSYSFRMTQNLDSMCSFNGASHYLSVIIIWEIDEEHLRSALDEFAKEIKDDIKYGISELPNAIGYCIKALSNGSENLIVLRDKIAGWVRDYGALTCLSSKIL